MVPHRVRRVLNRGRGTVHRHLFARTRGALGGRLGGMPVVRLETTGRRTGRRHTVMVNAPVRRDDAVLVVGSDGGADREPDWFRNLRETPAVRLQRRGDAGLQPARARVLDHVERDTRWPDVVAANDVYRDYQDRTGRTIPLAWLEPG